MPLVSPAALTALVYEYHHWNVPPKKLETPDNTTTWTQIACGYQHCAALSSKGEVFTWGGRCDYGEFGHYNSGDVPAKVEFLNGIKIVKVACGYYRTAAISAEGKLYVWGLVGEKAAPAPFHLVQEDFQDEVVVDVVIGNAQLIALTSSGSLYTWGEWGHGHNEIHYEDEEYFSSQNDPRNIIEHPKLLGKLGTQGFISISANKYHSACVTTAGQLHTWGCEAGCLGHGNAEEQHTPKLVEALSGIKCKQVSCGVGHTTVLTDDGKVFTFGSNSDGQLGHGNKETKLIPTQVRALETKTITQVQSNEYQTLALTASGFVFNWGGVNGTMESYVDLMDDYDYDSLVPRLNDYLCSHNVVEINSYFGKWAVLIDPSASETRVLQRLEFNNKDHSDVTFIVENQPIYAKIDTLSRKSEYFEAMFRCQMKESIERRVVIPDCSVGVFMKLLEYLYLDDFSLPKDDDTLEKLNELADMYLLEGLRLLCEVELTIRNILREKHEMKQWRAERRQRNRPTL